MFEAFQEALNSGDLNLVVTSTLGQIITWLIVLVLMVVVFVITARPKDDKMVGAKVIAYSGVAIALATVLSNLKLFQLPQGGSPTLFSMMVITSIGYIFGVRQGVLCGLAYGFIQLTLGGWVMHPVQLLLDYPLAFAALGLSGLYRNKPFALPIGYTIGIFARFLMHVISGVVFFAEYAGDQNPLIYSVIYNGSYIGLEGIASVVILLLPPVVAVLNVLRKNGNQSITA